MSTLRRLLTATGAVSLAAGTGLVVAAARPRRALPDALPPDPPRLPPGRAVAVPGHGELFVREAAGPTPDAPTILLLHGWMFPADLNWFTCYEPLSRVGRVIALDHRGHGRGSRPSVPFRLTDAADDAAALVRHLGTGPAVVVGYSMGGPITQLLWQRHPDVVRGMVLCATSATFSDHWRDRLVWRGMGVLQVVLRLFPRSWWEQLIRAQADGRLPVRVSRMINDEMDDDLRALLPWVLGELFRGSAEDLADAGRELSRYDGRGFLTSVDVPTAVLITAGDQLVPVDRQRDMARRIPTARVTELPLDHDAPGAGAGTFVPALVDAVRQVLAASAAERLTG